MTNLTLSIEEEDLRKARITALQQGTSLNAVIREFIKDYINRKQQNEQLADKILQTMQSSGYLGEDRKYSRDELYER
ncbi:MAG: DUF6364 family protein [Thiolinea sp.]